MIRKNIFDPLVLSEIAIKGLQEIKATNIVRMDLQKIDTAVTDYFVICTGTSDRHVQALADSVEDFMRDKTGSRPIAREGYQKGEWVLLDFTNVIVHIFLQEKRDFFRLEALWGDADIENIPDM